MKRSLLERLVGVTKETVRNLKKPASMLALGLALSYAAPACSFTVDRPEFVPQDTQEDVYEDQKDISGDNSIDGSGDINPFDNKPDCENPQTFYFDNDGDTFGDAYETETFCSEKEAEINGFVPNPLDCDDEVNYIHPDAEELCDGFDNNCDFNIDEGLEILAQCYKDFDDDGFGVEDDTFGTCMSSCGEGYAKHSGTKPFDCADDNDKVFPGAEEVCDLIDNNCENGNNEGFENLDYYPDVDGDNAGNMYAEAIKFCKEPTAEMKPAGMEDVEYVPNATDCEDGDPTINLNHPEICDGKDNNCNDEIDDGAPLLDYFKDNDGDGYGNEADGTWEGCGSKPGYVTKGGDCNNENNAIHPFAEEICNGLDDDCNNLIDLEDGLASIICYVDDDQDGFGLSDYSLETCETECPPFTSKTAGDCYDLSDAIHPFAEEICTTLDDNCNGLVDDGLEDVQACDVYNNNMNGLQTIDCNAETGVYEPTSECDDPDECAPQPQLNLKPCSTDVGVCEEGHEKYDCEQDDEGNYIEVLVEECDGVMPGVEDLGLEGCTVEDLNGLDDDCNGFVDEICNAYIPAGIFNMGCNPTFNIGCNGDNADHAVMLDDYEIGMHEVTNAQYLACIQALACSDSAGGSKVNDPAYANHPVTNVTWQQAKDYCEHAGGNLPTEAQWEKAARGEDSWQMFPWGDNLPNCNLVNYNMCVGETTEVDDYEDGVSPFGLFNMSGNVMEWVGDWSSAYQQGFQENPTGPEDGVQKVVRSSNYSDSEEFVTTYQRNGIGPSMNKAYIGLRCVTEPTDE
ncbi:SUMF1/EgtB/PvdO family nonheme iron enzyme [Candidatus Woesearchaeota archaeon]|nr:SUMF1/EgtB/PvdO family nonheme iron enzyme [Candidatus Woesearchaeota archaeon]